MKRPAIRKLLTLTLLLALQQAAHADYFVYVSTSGNDTANGMSATSSGQNGPVRTLERARDIVRMIRTSNPQLASPVRVVLASGVYRLTQTFALSAADSGTAASPTIYEQDGHGTATISGAVPLSAEGWAKPRSGCSVCAQFPAVKAYKLDSATQQLSAGQIEEGWSKPEDTPGGSELFFGGKRMPLARWPNQGYARINDVVAPSNQSFFAPADLPKSIQSESTLMARGYWHFDWADIAVHVGGVNPQTRQVDLQQPIKLYGGFIKNARFYLYNALSLLDSPGEWYYDQPSGTVYFWPPAALGSSTIEWSVVPHLVSMDGVAHVQFLGLAFVGARSDAITGKNLDSVEVRKCLIADTYAWGVIFSGKSSGISGTEMRELGRGGISLAGGDRTQLVSGGMFAQGNNIHDYSQLYLTNNPAVKLAGVGNVVRGNNIHHAPQQAVQFTGNNHMVEKNRIDDIGFDASDSGAIYTGRDWAGRGNVIRLNYLSDIQGQEGREIKGIYIDDQNSGITVDNNIFWNVQQAVFIGGGSDNVVTNNVFINSSPSIFLDNRGMTWEAKDSNNPNSDLQKHLAAVPYSSSVTWRHAYPQLATIKDDGFGIPRRNRFQHNYFVSSVPYRLLVPDAVKSYQNIDDPVQLSANWANVPQAPDLPVTCGYVLKIYDSADICR